MHFDERVVDFGRVKKGEKREHVFHFTNLGDAPLTIELITACDCTTITYDEGKTYAPGESGTIKIVFDSSKKDEAETISIDIILKQTYGEKQYPIIESLEYKFEMEK